MIQITQLKHDLIDGSEWMMAEDLINLLSSLEEATRALSGNDYASISMIIPTINTCIEQFTSLKLKSVEIYKFRACLVVSLKKRFLDFEENELLSISTLLDPRFKSSGFTKQLYVDSALNFLKLKLIEQDAVVDEKLNVDEDHDGQPRKKTKLDFTELISLSLKKRTNTAQNLSFEDEISSYLKIPNINIKDDVIQWWVDRKLVFPKLSKLALKFLIIPATSSESERIFSTAGLILNNKRSSLTSTHVSMILFLNKHLV